MTKLFLSMNKCVSIFKYNTITTLHLNFKLNVRKVFNLLNESYTNN